MKREEERNMNILRILGDLICIINENRKTGKATGDNYFRGEKKQGNKGFLKGGETIDKHHRYKVI